MAKLEEKIITRQSIYDGRVIKLSVVEVELPNGATAKRELIAHPGAVAMVALDENGDVLMVRQFRAAANRILLEIPAGTLKPGEDPLICAERELQEETGYRPGKLQSIGGIFVAPGYTSEYIHLYLATELTPSVLDMDEDEFIEAERVPLADALKRIDTGEICDAKSVTGLLRVSAMRAT